MEIMLRLSKDQSLVVTTAAKMKGLRPSAYARSTVFLQAKQELKILAKQMGDEDLVRAAIERMKEPHEGETF